ncbi:O-antigen polymerase [Bariatricus sp. HCP28S3_D3]|uniref:O-antigen polymerase n=1 Tax=Bariatricus sp. HCP28S3_D3 TaxID=3438901 RepID=UPI003F8C0443
MSSMIAFIMIFALFAFSIFINKILFKSNLNYANVFIIMYVFVMLLSLFSFFGFESVSLTTYLYLTIGLFSFEIFTLIFTSAIRVKKKIFAVYEPRSFIKLTLSCIILAILVPIAVKGFAIFKESGFNYLRWAWQGDYYDQRIRFLIVYFLSPLNTSLTCYSILELIQKRKVSINLLINFFTYIVLMFITAGRMDFLLIIMYMISALGFEYGGSISRIIKKNKKLIFSILALLLLIVAITGQRSLNSEKGLLYNVYCYFVGSIHLFDYYIKHTATTLLNGGNYLFGKGMLSPITDVFKIFIKGVGFQTNMLSGIEEINQIAQIYFTLNNGVVMNNNVTFAYVCLRDFGILGLVIDPAYMALVYAFIYKRYKVVNSVCSKAMLYYSIAILPFWIFEFYIARTPVMLIFVYMYFIDKFLYKKRVA